MSPIPAPSIPAIKPELLVRIARIPYRTYDEQKVSAVTSLLQTGNLCRVSQQNEETAWIPPDVLSVKRRLMILWANSGRSYLENEEIHSENAASHVEPLTEWVNDVLRLGCTQAELERHNKPLGNLTERESLDDSWDVEAAWPLIWALGLAQMPPWDEERTSPDSIEDFFDFPDPETWQPDLTLRRIEEIEEAAMAYETRMWRLRHAADVGDVGYARKLLKRAHLLGHVALAPDGDLALSNGESLSEKSEEYCRHLVSIVTERLCGLNWLCGQEREWDMVNPDSVVEWLWDEKWVGREED